jgi:DNA-binding transcriptional MerR regulator
VVSWDIGNPHETIDIGDVIARTKIPASTLHLWERRGLIHPVERVGLRRQYASDIYERLAFVVICQRGRFTLDTIVELATDMERGAKARLEHQLENLMRQRDELDSAIEGIQHAIHCPEPVPYDCPALKAKLAATFEGEPSPEQPQDSPADR